MLGYGFASVLLAHVVADFYAQSDAMAKKKAIGIRALAAHCVLYAAVFSVCGVCLLAGPSVVWVILGGCLSHAVVDVAKRFFVEKYQVDKLIVFGVDQAVHLAIDFAIVAVCADGLEPSTIAVWLGGALGEDTFARALALSLALLVAGRPIAILVSLILGAVEGRKYATNDEAESESLRAGRWIGVLERAIVVVMTLWGEFGAIAFVLTAKSIARFDLLKDQSFAERYLIGTLASVAAAILVALVARGLYG